MTNFTMNSTDPVERIKAALVLSDILLGATGIDEETREAIFAQAKVAIKAALKDWEKQCES